MSGFLTHPMSSEALKCELDLHTVPVTQICIESSKYVGYYPIAPVKDSKHIEFFIPGNGEDYLDLSNAFLSLAPQVTLENGTPLPDDSKVSPINNTFHSIFSAVSIQLGDKPITSNDQEYPYKAYLKTLASSDMLNHKSFLTVEMFYKDKSLSERNPDNAEKTDGLYLRHERCKKSAKMDMIGRLHLDICEQDKLIPNNVDVRLQLQISKPEFCLIIPDTDKHKYKLNIANAVLYVRQVKLNPSVMLAQEKSLKESTFKYPIRRTECRTFAISQGLREINIPNAILGPQPSFILMGLVDSTAKNGDMKLNPFYFDHKNVSYISVDVDGVQFPNTPYQPNFVGKEWARPYHGFYVATGQYYGTTAPSITYEDYGKGNTLYAFDLTADESALDGTHFNLVKNGSLRIDLKFQNPLDKNMTLILLAVFNNIIEIDQSRNVTTDY